MWRKNVPIEKKLSIIFLIIIAVCGLIMFIAQLVFAPSL